jgi:hypothetical protein
MTANSFLCYYMFVDEKVINIENTILVRSHFSSLSLRVT